MSDHPKKEPMVMSGRRAILTFTDPVTGEETLLQLYENCSYTVSYDADAGELNVEVDDRRALTAKPKKG